MERILKKAYETNRVESKEMEAFKVHLDTFTNTMISIKSTGPSCCSSGVVVREAGGQAECVAPLFSTKFCTCLVHLL